MTDLASNSGSGTSGNLASGSNKTLVESLRPCEPELAFGILVLNPTTLFEKPHGVKQTSHHEER